MATLKDRGGQVLDGALAGPDRLAVDVPTGLPDLGGELLKEAGLGHEVAEFGPIAPGEGLDRQEAAGAGGMPL